LRSHSEVTKKTHQQTFQKLLYDKKELAAALAVSPQTIMSEVSKGRLRVTHIGDRILFSADEVKRYVAACTQKDERYDG
jgi:excisionase family DNA binding protein